MGNKESSNKDAIAKLQQFQRDRNPDGVVNVNR